MYFPQLTHAYETPQAQDWSQYGLLDPNYQPWSVQGGQQFVPENIWNYAPPQINRQPVQYSGPPMGGLMEVAAHGPSSGNKPPMTPQEMIESGLYDGNPGDDNERGVTHGIDHSFGSALADALGLGIGESEADVEADIAAANAGHGVVA